MSICKLGISRVSFPVPELHHIHSHSYGKMYETGIVVPGAELYNICTTHAGFLRRTCTSLVDCVYVMIIVTSRPICQCDFCCPPAAAAAAVCSVIYFMSLL